MARSTSAITRVSKLEEQSLGGTLSALLSITSDAVICFDGAGTILLANDEALRLLALDPMRAAGTNLVGSDIRLLFPPAVGVVPDSPFTTEELPLPTDGSTARIVRPDIQGHTVTLVARCERVHVPQETYLLVAHPESGTAAVNHENERLVAELSRANRRLVGTLDIVLGTLSSPDVSTLFERVLEELCVTMDASGSTVYLAEADGLHLRGTSASLEGQKVPRFLSRKRSLIAAVAQSDRAMRLRVLPPNAETLRKGKLTSREVMDEETRKTYRIRGSLLPPFTSFLAVPVRFGGQVIALIEVGWRVARTIPREDAELLDAVTRYLAVQLVGAFSALRTQRREQLASRANDLRDALVAEPLSSQTRYQLLDAVAQDLDCVCAPLDGPSAIDGHEVLHLPLSHKEVALSDDLLDDRPGVTELLPEAPLSLWLREREEPCLGAFVDSGAEDDERIRFLALRPADAEPFDDLELEYLRQVADTISAVSSGQQDRKRDHRISQALQSGMRSELQKVPGISAQGIYSSATEAAFVGGDFYDLIRLPNRRACVVMGDVSGKGVEAASVSAAVRTALAAYSWEGMSPARMVSLLNEFLLGFARVETFATLFVGIIDLDAGRMTYCSAGHPPAIMLRARTGELEWLGVQSGVVGAFHEMTYRNGRVTLNPGDTLLLYTDGTTEARARDGLFFGEDGLRDAVMQEGPRGFDGLLDRLLATVDAFTGNSLDDDVAMVALRFDTVGEMKP